MKKTIYSIFATAIVSLASIATMQAQCISSTPSQQQNIVAPTPGNAVGYRDYSVNLGNYSTYKLPANGSVKYSFTSSFCFNNNNNSCYPGNSSYMTLTDENNKVLAFGYPPLTYSTNKAMTVRVHQFTDINCGTGIGSNANQYYSVSATLCGYQYRDADGDGYGDKNNRGTYGCPLVLSPGYVADSMDCNDANVKETVVKKWYPDLDGDGFGDMSAKPTISCTQPKGLLRTEGTTTNFLTDSTDCDDTNPAINSGAHEVLGNNIDENCDNAININNALNFNRAGVSFIQAPNSNSLSLGTDFTIEAWVKSPSDGNSYTIVSKGAYEYLFSVYGKKLAFYEKNSATWNYSTLDFPANTWTHAAITSNGGNLTFYINGTEQGTASVSTSPGTGLFNIGSQTEDCNCNIMDGSIDELRIWNITRSASEINGNMSKALEGNESGLGAYYTFDQGFPNDTNTSITSLKDKTANANDGKFKNFALIGKSGNFVNGVSAFNIAPKPIITANEIVEVANNTFSIYPNPSNGTFSISSTSEIGNVVVLNSLGSVVYQNTISAKQWNIELPSKEAGIYFVKVGNKMTKLVRE